MQNRRLASGQGGAATSGTTIWPAGAATALRTAIDGTVATKLGQTGPDDVGIRVTFDDPFRGSTDQLVSLPLVSNKGNIVHLGSVGTIMAGSAPA